MEYSLWSHESNRKVREKEMLPPGEQTEKQVATAQDSSFSSAITLPSKEQLVATTSPSRDHQEDVQEQSSSEGK